MKSLTPQAVKYAALLLIETNGETSSLMVKNHLRELGYHATQSEVSSLLYLASEELPLTKHLMANPNHYWVYSLPTPAAVVADDKEDNDEDDSDDDTVFFQKSYSYTKRDGTVVIGYDINSLELAKEPHWVVYSAKSIKELTFSDVYTRDEARFAYAKIVGIHHHDTRAVFEG